MWYILRSNNALHLTPPPPIAVRCRLAVQAASQVSLAVRPQTKASPGREQEEVEVTQCSDLAAQATF